MVFWMKTEIGKVFRGKSFSSQCRHSPGMLLTQEKIKNAHK